MEMEVETPKLFQVHLTRETLDQNAKITRDFSIERAGLELLNCTNLTFVMLGIIQDPSRYLAICTRRKEPTTREEAKYYIKSALFACGLDDRVDESIFVNMKVFEELKESYGTPVFITYRGGIGHTVLIWRSSAGLQYIDAQDRVVVTGENNIIEFLKNKDTISVLVYMTHAIIEDPSKCQITLSPMETNGGRKNERKQNHVKKFHAVRTRRNQHRRRRTHMRVLRTNTRKLYRRRS
jgi:hypothetical protein